MVNLEIRSRAKNGVALFDKRKLAGIAEIAPSSP
jgi:hypothetical protein